MTARRQQRDAGRAGRLLSCAVGLLLGLGPPVAALSAAYIHIVTDPLTGLAINGFDPVAYFTDAAATPGRADMEFNKAGTVWRFRNEGNRAAFAENPEVYTPQFGGYDPIAIANGKTVPGHPQLWLVTGQRLYLFYSAKDRDAFAAEPARMLEAAERGWPAVQRLLP